MPDVYLDSRQTKELARGGMVQVRLDGGDSIWIDGSDVRGYL